MTPKLFLLGTRKGRLTWTVIVLGPQQVLGLISTWYFCDRNGLPNDTTSFNRGRQRCIVSRQVVVRNTWVRLLPPGSELLGSIKGIMTPIECLSSLMNVSKARGRVVVLWWMVLVLSRSLKLPILNKIHLPQCSNRTLLLPPPNAELKVRIGSPLDKLAACVKNVTPNP